MTDPNQLPPSTNQPNNPWDEMGLHPKPQAETITLESEVAPSLETLEAEPEPVTLSPNQTAFESRSFLSPTGPNLPKPTEVPKLELEPPHMSFPPVMVSASNLSASAQKFQTLKIALAAGPFVLLGLLATTMIVLNQASQTPLDNPPQTEENTPLSEETTSSAEIAQTFVQQLQPLMIPSDYQPLEAPEGDGTPLNPFRVSDSSDPVWQQLLPLTLRLEMQPTNDLILEMVQPASLEQEHTWLMAYSDQSFDNRALRGDPAEEPSVHWLDSSVEPQPDSGSVRFVIGPYSGSIYYSLFLKINIQDRWYLFSFGSQTDPGLPNYESI